MLAFLPLLSPAAAPRLSPRLSRLRASARRAPPPPRLPPHAARAAMGTSAPDTDAPAMARAAAVLRDTFGHAGFRRGQREVVKLLVAPPEGAPARALAVFPTGAGKSLTYQLPAMVYEEGVTLVVSPLLALMRDQTQALVKKGVPAAALDSSLDAAETRELYENVRAGAVKLLFVAPERFKNERFVRLVKRVPVALFVVDEAHCVSEWGHSFRPDYLRLQRFADELGFQRRLCLTATATPEVAKDIAEAMSIPYPAGMVKTPSLRPNLDTRITLIPSSFDGKRTGFVNSIAHRIDALATRIKSRPAGATIIYVTMQMTAVEVAQELRKRGLIDCKAYHAGLPKDERQATQDWFMASKDGESAIICATIAFGMGIDKPNIRSVYHFNLPMSLEAYTQEIGRAGRDGLHSVCEVLACIDDIPVCEGYARGGTPSRKSVSEFVESLLGGKKQGDKVDISVYDASRELDIKDLTLNQMLAQLDMNGGFIRELTPFYSELKCKVEKKAEWQDILSADTRAAKILALGTGSATIRSVDCRKVSEELNIEKGVISRELDDLARDGKLTRVTPHKLRSQFEVTKTPSSLEEVVDMLYKAAKRKEAKDVSRIQDVIDFLSADSCQTKLMSKRFGDDVGSMPDCGHCAVCHAGGQQVATIEDEQVKRIGRTLDVRRWALIQAQSELPRDNPILLARFAAGISSPRISQLYKKLPGFGTMSDHSYETLLEAAEAECATASG